VCSPALRPMALPCEGGGGGADVREEEGEADVDVDVPPATPQLLALEI